jgi:hypothetical protein
MWMASAICLSISGRVRGEDFEFDRGSSPLGLTPTLRLGLGQDPEDALAPAARGGYLQQWRPHHGAPPSQLWGHSGCCGWWSPWWSAPRSRRVKKPAPYYSSPRLGLHTLYPEADEFGLILPVDEEVEAAVAAQTPEFSPLVAAALERLAQGKLAESGRLLSRELALYEGGHAPTELQIATVEVLFAAGKHNAAAQVLIDALEAAPTVSELHHFRVLLHLGKAAYEASQKSLAAAIEKTAKDTPAEAALLLLQATIQLMAGEGERAMTQLEALQRSAAVGPLARRLHRQHLELLFGAPAPGGAEKPAESALEPPAKNDR